MAVETTLLAQVVLTLRHGSFGRDGPVLITIEWSRIYAVTSKGRIITACFCVITISQLIIGLCLTAYAATAGGESMTNAAHYSYLFQCFSGIRPIGPTSGLYTVRFFWRRVFGNRIYRHSSRIRYGSSIRRERPTLIIPQIF